MMKTPILPQETNSNKIAAAVQEVYKQAGIEIVSINSGVVSLSELIGAYPIRVAELENLTTQSAAKFLAAETGQDVPMPKTEDQKLAGFLYAYEYAGVFYGCILVEKNEPVTRRRFSAAHELGHYLLHFLPLLESHIQDNFSESLVLAECLYIDENQVDSDVLKGQLTLTSGVKAKTYAPPIDKEQMEREANQFAAELLMPADACEELAKRYSRRFGRERKVLANRLATEFLVSKKAMIRRLEELELPEKLLNYETQQPKNTTN
ncbi:ImmA/IrrE family metallo-endopeptidase [Calothrix sp. UHCC 0171]|uniref:ImmA/IrrE family metallo-endopeptidase n=1 Tax=Calothrix sp. UHCC 0171 TaxID=3110245 RepID=UPI002B1FFEFC|nr:ImmA/IrrE family metallo-endopeptidase [Calothrix sp. UHCC 0171]MEA5573849.1 ImmA/IrrE family metallo-endopeptidase [Calothrix sp. UHCC 0171]